MNLQLGFSFIAGLLTTLSPCVLPILPFLIDSALRKNRRAPLYMIFGLALSFITVGFLLSRFGTLFGFGSDEIRKFSALILAVTSLFFLSSELQDFVSEKMTGFVNFGTKVSGQLNVDESSAWGSLILGSLLGIIWSPCAGPALGVAVSMASQEGQSFSALKIMMVYAAGASIPMLLIAYGLRSYVQKNMDKIFNFTENSKKFFGTVLLFTGVFIFFGLDKSIETFLLNNLPASWVDLITKF
jgi:cytochrome c-type biogenesis protein